MPIDTRHTDPSPSRVPILRAVALMGLALGLGYAASRWLESRQTATFPARLHAHETVVLAPADSRIESLVAASGTVVDAGRRLAVLIDSGREQRRERALQQLSALEQELAQTVAKAEVNLAWRLRTIEGERHEARLRQAAFLKEKFDSELALQAIDEDRPGSVSLLEPSRLVRPATFDRIAPSGLPQELRLKREAAVNAAEVAAAQVALCDRRLEQLDKLVDKLPQQIRKAAGIDSIETRIARARSDLQRIDSEPRSIELAAPEYGTVGKWRRRLGDSIEAEEPLVTIFDEDRRFLLVRVPSESLAAFREGMEVALQFPGGEKRTGIVGPIPRQTRSASADDARPRAPADIDLRIEPAGKLWPQAPIGSAVKVRIER